MSMPDPRTFGSPIGRGKAINTGRTKPGPAPASTVHDYLSHMINADQAYHAQRRPQGSSGGLGGVLAKGNPPVGIGGKRREATIMGNVEKMAR
jgi:hypothetical protein